MNAEQQKIILKNPNLSLTSKIYSTKVRRQATGKCRQSREHEAGDEGTAQHQRAAVPADPTHTWTRHAEERGLQMSLLISRWHLISKHSSFHYVSPFMWCSCRLNTLRTNALLLANTEPRYRTSDFPKLDPTETFLSTRFDQSTHCHNYLEHWEPKYTMGKKKAPVIKHTWVFSALCRRHPLLPRALPFSCGRS